MATPSNRRRRPRFGADGSPEHGAAWDEGVVLKGTSRGPGVPVQVSAPRPGPIRRVVSGLGRAYVTNGKTYIVPAEAASGTPISLVVEYD